MSINISKNPQYNDDYYRAQAILNSRKYYDMKMAYLAKLKNLGIEIPPNGISDGPTRLKLVKYLHSTGPLFNEFLSSVINAFNVHNNKHGVENAIKYNLLYSSNVDHISLENALLLKIPESKDCMEVSFKVFPWTRKEDVIEGLWEHILYQMSILGWKKEKNRNREKSTFIRDLKVYELYLLKSKDPSGFGSLYTDVVTSHEFKKIKDEYKAKESYDESIGFVITNMKRLLKDLELI